MDIEKELKEISVLKDGTKYVPLNQAIHLAKKSLLYNLRHSLNLFIRGANRTTGLGTYEFLAATEDFESFKDVESPKKEERSQIQNNELWKGFIEILSKLEVNKEYSNLIYRNHLPDTQESQRSIVYFRHLLRGAGYIQVNFDRRRHLTVIKPIPHNLEQAIVLSEQK